ncbi:hypothetical protein KLP40_14490 [Hymenobacter sp. NST-14]|uniref:hypothetical protein n=1 Tax=Hymenobacter piscis TaxID=2839984 RepID=UPI001C01496C|nr:hypothetical protein [Hymenobacter piscis]MBT9394376.1 hypothetical protein [Hymenobacter piscis]
MRVLYPPYNRTLSASAAGTLLAIVVAALLQRFLPPLPVLAVAFLGLHLAAGPLQQGPALRRREYRRSFILLLLGQASLAADFITEAIRHPAPRYGLLLGFVGGAMLVLLVLGGLRLHLCRRS